MAEMNQPMIVRAENQHSEVLVIIEKYEMFVTYLYPIIQTSPRKHGVLRDTVLAALFEPIGALYQAAKSKQVSRLHAVDAQFATLRSYLRFLVLPNIKMINPHQHSVALAKLAEAGKILGSWIKKLDQSGARARSMGQAGQ